MDQTPQSPEPDRGDDFRIELIGRVVTPPAIAFVVGGAVLLTLPAASGVTAEITEMLGLLFVVYTAAMFGVARAREDESSVRRWRLGLIAAVVVAVALSIAVRILGL